MGSKNDIQKRIIYYNSLDKKIEKNDNHHGYILVEYSGHHVSEVMQVLNPEEIYLQKEEYLYLNYIIKEYLTPTERSVVEMSYGFNNRGPYSNRYIAKYFNTTSSEIARIIKRALIKIEFYLKNEEKIKKSFKK